MRRNRFKKIEKKERFDLKLEIQTNKLDFFI